MINTAMAEKCCPELKPQDEAEQLLRRLYSFGAAIQGQKTDHFYFQFQEVRHILALHDELKIYLAEQLKKSKQKKK